MTSNFPPLGVPSEGDLVLITDELNSPADFLLHRLLASHFKGKENGKIVRNVRCAVLSVSEDVEKWKGIAAKSNLNLTRLVESHSLTFLDVVSYAQELPYIDDKKMGVFRKLLDDLRTLFPPGTEYEGSEDPEPRLVILDDVASLEWIGIPSAEVVRFVRALAFLCRKLNASLVIRHHIVTPDEPDDVLRVLLQICTYHIDVFPLSSGRSGTVSGQIALHPGAGQVLKRCKPRPRSSALQYKLTDAGCVFFDRGTSSGVL